ncbi:MAG: DUF4130 domain-containing protein [bacterium]
MNQLQLFENLEGTKAENRVKDRIQEINKAKNKQAFNLFRRELFFALLNKDETKYQLADKVIDQIKAKGLSYVLCKISDEARRFRNLARQVKMEYNRAISFSRLKPVDQQRVLLGKFEIKHQTQEMIMLHFMRRFPQYNIVFIFGDEAYIGRDKEIFREKIDRKKIELPEKKDEFEQYWLTFYRTQFIPERRNIRYLKRMIPKKYWKWTVELKEFGLK